MSGFPGNKQLNPLAAAQILSARNHKVDELDRKHLLRIVKSYPEKVGKREGAHQFALFLEPHNRMPYRIVKKSSEDISDKKRAFLKTVSGKDHINQYKTTEYLARIGKRDEVLSVCAFHIKNGNQHEFRRWCFLSFCLLWANRMSLSQHRDEASQIIKTMSVVLNEFLGAKDNKALKSDFSRICVAFKEIAQTAKCAEDFFVEGKSRKMRSIHADLLKSFNFSPEEILFFEQLMKFAYEYKSEYNIENYALGDDLDGFISKLVEFDKNIGKYLVLYNSKILSLERVRKESFSWYYLIKLEKNIPQGILSSGGQEYMHDMLFLKYNWYDPSLYRSKSRIERMQLDMVLSDYSPRAVLYMVQQIWEGKREEELDVPWPSNQDAYDLFDKYLIDAELDPDYKQSMEEILDSVFVRNILPLTPEGQTDYARLIHYANKLNLRYVTFDLILNGRIEAKPDGSINEARFLEHLNQNFTGAERDVLYIKSILDQKYNPFGQDQARVIEEALIVIRRIDPKLDQRMRVSVYDKVLKYGLEFFLRDCRLFLEIAQEVNTLKSYLACFFFLFDVNCILKSDTALYRKSLFELSDKQLALINDMPESSEKTRSLYNHSFILNTFYNSDIATEEEKYTLGLDYAKKISHLTVNFLVGYIYFSQLGDISKQLEIKEFLSVCSIGSEGSFTASIMNLLLDIYEDVVEEGQIGSKTYEAIEKLIDSCGFEESLKVLAFDPKKEMALDIAIKEIIPDSLQRKDFVISQKLGVALIRFVKFRGQKDLWVNDCKNLMQYTELFERNLKDPDHYGKLIYFFEHLDELMTAHEKKIEAQRVEREQKLLLAKERTEEKYRANEERRERLRLSRRQSVVTRAQDSSKALMNKFRQDKTVRQVAVDTSMFIPNLSSKHQVDYLSTSVKKQFELLLEQNPKAKELWEEILLDPLSLEGLGQPEVLKREFVGYKGAISRRINDYDRLVYKFTSDQKIIVLSCEGHYEDQAKKH